MTDDYDLADDVRRLRSELGLVKAKNSIERPKDAYRQFPWPTIHRLAGHIAPKKLWYVVMASNNGKTTFIRSMVERLLERGERVYLMSTETTEEDFRLSMIAQELGFYPGDLTTGEYLSWPNAEEVVIQVADRITQLRTEKTYLRNLQISSHTDFLNAPAIRLAASEAEDQGADWFLVDHGDHVDPTASGGEMAQSAAVNAAIHRETKRHNFRTVVTSQLNQEPFKLLGKAAMCQPVMEHWVRYGGMKKQLADGILTAHRPWRQPPPSDDELRAFKAGEIPIAEVTIPGAMRFSLMKSRDYGARVGEKGTLDVVGGRVDEPSLRETGALIHGIQTAPRALL